MRNLLDEHIRQVTDSLENLTPSKRAAFAAAIAETLYPNYLAFSKNKRWGDPSVLRSALDLVWKSVDGSPITAESAVDFREKIEKVTPDMEEFGSDTQGSLALDAATAVHSALACALNGDPDEATTAARSAIDSKYMNLENATEELNTLLQRPEVQKEFEYQRELLNALQNMSRISKERLLSL